MPRELIVYIHGVSDQDVSYHTDQYQALHAGIREYKPDAGFPEAFCGIEWGWHPPDMPNPESHFLLARAQDFIEPGTNAHAAASTASAKKVPETLENLRALKKLALTDRLRVRRLYTFGSPISMLACRSDETVQTLANQGKLRCADYGLTRNPFEPLHGPRWHNLWDKDDPIAWPVRPLMDTPGDAVVVHDEYFDVSDDPLDAHGEYWTDKAFHKYLARTW